MHNTTAKKKDNKLTLHVVMMVLVECDLFFFVFKKDHNVLSCLPIINFFVNLLFLVRFFETSFLYSLPFLRFH